jgi:hypothetical protein
MLLERELFTEIVGVVKFMQFLVHRLPSDEYAVITRLEEDYFNAVLDEYVLQKAMQTLVSHQLTSSR